MFSLRFQLAALMLTFALSAVYAGSGCERALRQMAATRAMAAAASRRPPTHWRTEAKGFAAAAVEEAPTHRTKIDSVEQFAGLAKSVHTGGGEMQVVKVVYQRNAKDGPELFFLDTNQFPFHYSFATGVLDYKGSVRTFNQNYLGTGETRDFNAASLVRSPGTGKGGKDQWLLELWTGDTLSGKYVEELYKKVKAGLPKGTELVFHPLSSQQEKMIVDTTPKVPSITTRELYKDKKYWPLNEGVAYGYVKFVNTADIETKPPLLDLTHIAVFDQVPNDIGLLGGVITEDFQTPLSHVNVKSMNRGTVNFSLRDAKELLKPYEGKAIELKAGPNGYEIRELPADQADRLIAEFWAGRKPKLKGKITSRIDPQYAKDFVRLDGYYRKLPTKKEHQKLIQTVGAKAANLSLIGLITEGAKHDGLKGVDSPKTIGVPFNHFDAFMDYEQKGLDLKNPKRKVTPRQLIDEILKREGLLNPNVIHPVAKTRPALDEIRAIIQRSEVPPEMLDLFKRYVMEDTSSPIHYSKISKLRLRSSTNSEDLDGFTGAGLYNSLGVRLYTKKSQGTGKPEVRDWKKIKDDLREAIPFLYSSVWNERAFYEREWFSLNGEQHQAVKVGIALHGGFPLEQKNGEPGEIGNGVAVTENIFNPEDQGKIYLNGQHYDFSITNPPTPEELKEMGEAGDPKKNPYETEEILVTTFLADESRDGQPDAWMDWPVELVKTSSLNGGKPVLTEQETRTLAYLLKVVSDSMAKVYGKSPEDFVIDAEWKIFGTSRTLWLKQARPFSEPEK